MIEVDIREDRAVQRKLQMGAVALISFNDEPIAPRPLGTGANIAHVAADHKVWSEASFGEDQHEHRRCRGLAVGARDRHRLCLRADGCQHAGSPERGDTEPPRLVEFVEVLRDRRRSSYGVATHHMGSLVADVNRDASRAEAIEDLLLADIDTGNVVAHLGQHECDGTHSRATHANHVQTLRR